MYRDVFEVSENLKKDVVKKGYQKISFFTECTAEKITTTIGLSDFIYYPGLKERINRWVSSGIASIVHVNEVFFEMEHIPSMNPYVGLKKKSESADKTDKTDRTDGTDRTALPEVNVEDLIEHTEGRPRMKKKEVRHG